MNEKSFWEMEILEKVLNPKPVADVWDDEGSVYTWFCESDNEYPNGSPITFDKDYLGNPRNKRNQFFKKNG